MKKVRKNPKASEALTRGQLRLELDQALNQKLKPYATKDFVENKINELAKITERAFQKVATKDDLKSFATKEDLKDTEERIKAYFENREADLEDVHQDELASVEGKKEAPRQWKSIPRRLKTVEVEVEKIKDHLTPP